jgi:hypothetical protein
MTEQEIDDLRGVFAESLTLAEREEFWYYNGEAFIDHCIGLHPAEYSACDNPACQAGFEAEILCDLYVEMNR